MFWRKKKVDPLSGYSGGRQSASSKDTEVEMAFNLGRVATELIFAHKFRDAQNAANEAINLFQSLRGQEIEVAKCYGLLGEALNGLGSYGDASEAYLIKPRHDFVYASAE